MAFVVTFYQGGGGNKNKILRMNVDQRKTGVIAINLRPAFSFFFFSLSPGMMPFFFSLRSGDGSYIVYSTTIQMYGQSKVVPGAFKPLQIVFDPVYFVCNDCNFITRIKFAGKRCTALYRVCPTPPRRCNAEIDKMKIPVPPTDENEHILTNREREKKNRRENQVRLLCYTRNLR